MGSLLEYYLDYTAHIEVESYAADSGEMIVRVRYDGEYLSLPVMAGRQRCRLEEFSGYVSGINTKFEDLPEVKEFDE